MRSTNVSQEQIVRILGLPACATLEYYWEDMNFLPDEIIPHKLLEGDFAMQEALMRLCNRTDLAKNIKKGWRLNIAVYEAVMALTPEQEKLLYRTELIRQTIAGAMEKCGVLPMEKLSDCFRKLNVPEDVWREAYADQFDAIYHEIRDEDTCYAASSDLEAWEELMQARYAAGVSAAEDPLALRLSGGWLPGEADIYFDVLEWMSRQGVSPEDGAVVIQNALYAMHNSGEEADFLDEIAGAFELDELPADAESILETLLKHVPRWELDGVSAHELYLMQHPDLSGDSPF